MSADGKGIYITRSMLQSWAGEMTDAEVERVGTLLEFSTVPDAVSMILDSIRERAAQ